MTPEAARRWKFCARLMKTLGSFGCVVTFGLSLFLIAYYSANRPKTPDSATGLTVGLSWTHPTSYGTAQDENWLQWSSFWFVPSFGLIFLGEAIKAYKLNDYSGYRRK
jgi:hypothetical protein